MEKKFSKIQIYKYIGFVQGDYDDSLHRIRRKPINYFKSLAIYLLTISGGSKITVSSLFIDKEAPIQFFIGSWFNYLPQVSNVYQSARFYIGLSGK